MRRKEEILLTLVRNKIILYWVGWIVYFFLGGLLYIYLYHNTKSIPFVWIFLWFYNMTDFNRVPRLFARFFPTFLKEKINAISLIFPFLLVTNLPTAIILFFFPLLVCRYIHRNIIIDPWNPSIIVGRWQVRISIHYTVCLGC